MARSGRVLSWTGRLLTAVLAGGLVACDAPGAVDPAVTGTPGAGAAAPAAGASLATPDIASLAPGAGDWPMYGHDASRTKYNPDETLLAPQTVGQLVPRWQANVGIGGALVERAQRGRRAGLRRQQRAQRPQLLRLRRRHRRAGLERRPGLRGSCFNVGIGATPAISGSLVVAGGGDSAYYGLDAANRAPALAHPLNAGASGFPWASPLLANGRAYLGMASRCDNPSVRGEVRAVDLATAPTLASQYFVPAGQAGARHLELAGAQPRRQHAGRRHRRGLQRLQRPLYPRHGHPRPAQPGHPPGQPARRAHQDQDYATTPVIFHDSQGRTLVGANHKDGTFYAYDLNNLDAGPLWSAPTGTSVGMMPAYDPTFGAGGTLFFIDGGGQLYAVDPATGADRWPPVTVGAAHGNMAVANGLIFSTPARPAWRHLRRDQRAACCAHCSRPTPGQAYSGVAVANGFVYWMSGAYLNAWSLP